MTFFWLIHAEPDRDRECVCFLVVRSNLLVHPITASHSSSSSSFECCVAAKLAKVYLLAAGVT